MSVTERVREELAHLPVDLAHGPHEAAGILRAAGSLTLGGGGGSGFGVVVRTPSGAVARRLRATLLVLGAAPDVEVHRPGGMERRSTYRLRLRAGDGPAGGEPVLRRLGLLDAAGRPADPVAPRPGDARAAVLAYVRGTAMGGLSLSGLRAAAHAEIAAGGEAAARHLAALLAVLGAPGARAGAHGDAWRVVSKSGQEIGALLAALGAHSTFLAWDDARLRRELRGEANRVANADRANLVRAVGAAARHVAAITRIVEDRGWEGIPEGLRDVALARVANPEASLAELGALLDPPLGKGAVHRRLGALSALAETGDGAG
jgi:cell division protein WhiA